MDDSHLLDKGAFATLTSSQQQQLELAAGVLLVPAKLPLDLGADALGLLLLRGQAAAAGHGTRRGDRSPSAAILRPPPAWPTRDPHRVQGEKTGADLSLGVRGLHVRDLVPPRGSVPRRGRIRSAGNAQVIRAQPAPHSLRGGGVLSWEVGSVAGPQKTRAPLGAGTGHRAASRDRAWKVGASVLSGKNGSPGPGDVPGKRLEAEDLTSQQSSESDCRLGMSGKVPAGASGCKWQKEAERLEPAALASAQVGLRGTPSWWRLGAKGTSRELGSGARRPRVSGSSPDTCFPAGGNPTWHREGCLQRLR